MRGLKKIRRKIFVQAAVAMCATFLVAVCAASPRQLAGQQKQSPCPNALQEISPAEDLMREHGVLKRILLIYGEAIRRINAGEELQPTAVADAAGIIRSFIEDYHERLEEEHLFPRFLKAGKLVDLVGVLIAQHRAGRKLTDIALKLSDARAMKAPQDRRALAQALDQFIRMYGPHEAREDTVLFPALRTIVTAEEYEQMGDAFEDKEHALFGENGFERIVGRVVEIEKRLGIYDLSQFTPR